MTRRPRLRAAPYARRSLAACRATNSTVLEHRVRCPPRVCRGHASMCEPSTSYIHGCAVQMTDSCAMRRLLGQSALEIAVPNRCAALSPHRRKSVEVCVGYPKLRLENWAQISTVMPGRASAHEWLRRAVRNISSDGSEVMTATGGWIRTSAPDARTRHQRMDAWTHARGTSIRTVQQMRRAVHPTDAVAMSDVFSCRGMNYEGSPT